MDLCPDTQKHTTCVVTVVAINLASQNVDEHNKKEDQIPAGVGTVEPLFIPHGCVSGGNLDLDFVITV